MLFNLNELQPISFKKAAECLYRNPPSRTYYPLAKSKGKQHKWSLKTFDLAEGQHKLRDYRAEVTAGQSVCHCREVNPRDKEIML